MHTNSQVFDNVLKLSWGQQNKLADKLGVSRQTIYIWQRRKIPAEKVVAISKALGIPREQLRPDLYM